MQRLNEPAEDAFKVLADRVYGFLGYIEEVRHDYPATGMVPMTEITHQFLDECPDDAAAIINAALDFVAGMDGFKLRDPAGG